MDRPFVYLSTDEGPVLINLFQIVKVTMPTETEDKITFHMSDGRFSTFNGAEIVLRIVMLLKQYTIDVYGQHLPLANFEDELTEAKAKAQS